MQLPGELIQHLKTLPDFAEQAFEQAHGLPAVVSVRLNDAKPTPDTLPYTGVVPWCAAGRYLAHRPVFTMDPAFHAGAYYVQEASSMFLDHLLRTVLLPAGQALRVLDLCAAPGGKSTLMASLLPPDGLLLCNEVIRSRASVLAENLTRWGYGNAWAASNDPAVLGRLTGYFDAVLADVPCSGSGLFRKDAQAWASWSTAHVALCVQRQQRILADIWPALKENGLFIYATCSYSPEENEAMLDKIAAMFPVESIPVPLQAQWGIVETTSPLYGLKGYRFFPHLLQGEGFFIAAVRKSESAAAVKMPKFKSNHQEKIKAQAAHLLQDKNWLCLPAPAGQYRAIHPDHEPDFHLLGQQLYIRKAGIALGAPSAKEWMPAHDAAMSKDVAQALPGISLTHTQALGYLKKEALPVAPPAKGWYLVRHEKGWPLGWAKSLGSRLNNYLPAHWRIRMDIHNPPPAAH